MLRSKISNIGKEECCQNDGNFVWISLSLIFWPESPKVCQIRDLGDCPAHVWCSAFRSWFGVDLLSSDHGIRLGLIRSSNKLSHSPSLSSFDALSATSSSNLSTSLSLKKLTHTGISMLQGFAHKRRHSSGGVLAKHYKQHVFNNNHGTISNKSKSR